MHVSLTWRISHHGIKFDIGERTNRRKSKRNNSKNLNTVDDMRRLSESFPTFRCIGMLPRIYWRETVSFCTTHHTRQTAKPARVHRNMSLYPSRDVHVPWQRATSRGKFWISLRSGVFVAGNILVLWRVASLRCISPFQTDYLNKAIYTTHRV